MRRSLLLVSALLGVYCTAALGSYLMTSDPYGTADKRSLGVTSNVSGRVVSANLRSIQIQTEAGNRMTFSLSRASRLPEMLSLGDIVSIEYSETAEGRYHASRIIQRAMSVTGAASSGETFHRDAVAPGAGSQ